MKKALLTTILCISWELNAQVALPTFQGAQMPTPELEDTEWRFTADGVNNAGTSYYNSTSGSSSHSWTVPANVSHITILGISGGGGGSASTSTSGSGGISAGVKAGGRTGMTSLVIGLLFLLCLFFAPLATSLPKEIDGAALIYIATLFVRNIVDIEWDDIAESGPAVLAMIAMPFTYSISHGIALAFISYAAIKICTGKTNVSPAIWVIAAASVISFVVA